ncbi:hypothetical protein L6R29_08445 [Myxococcota bacterium]|nr:hypothetical protein [Myxococcota bacterium]
MLTYKAMYKFLEGAVHGEVLPIPDPKISDTEAELEEPIHLLLTAAPSIAISAL